jgi:hypothetical protein
LFACRCIYNDDKQYAFAKAEGDLDQAGDKLHEFCARIKQGLNSCSLKEKRYALNALDITVIATDDKMEIKASVPLESASAEKVSRCVIKRVRKPHKRRPTVSEMLPSDEAATIKVDLSAIH